MGSICSPLVILSLVLLAAGAPAFGASSPPAVAGLHQGGPVGSAGCDVHEEERARLEQWEEAHNSRPADGALLGAEPAPYRIHPQAGNVSGDLWPNSFVDLDPAAGVLDFDCTAIAAEGHRGNDTDLRTFTEQQIGVPVLAALDGTVVDVHDGEPDMNLACVEPSNLVVLDHGGSHYSWYLHLKNGSVAVALDDFVTAGTQIGLTASSGCSFWPHLHFESRFAGTHYEPNSGPCRSGASYWQAQEPIRRDTFLTDFTITADDLTLWQGAPFDTDRTGHLVTGTVPHFWFLLKNLPANSTWRTRFRRPGGALALDQSGGFENGEFFRSSAWWQRWFLDLDEVGSWTLIYDVNGTTLVEAPFEVVASAGQIVNRPPHPIAVALDPPIPREGDVVFCRIDTSLTLDDPDYDVVRYHYTWRVNGGLERQITHAGQADALPWDALGVGDSVECTVTPSDGTADGPMAQTLSIVRQACSGPAEACIFADGFETGDTTLWSSSIP